MDYTEQDILDNMRLVYILAHNARKKCPYSLLDFDDFVSEGSIGLMKALEDFEPERGFKFASYAQHRIRGVMIEAHRKAYRQLRIAGRHGEPMPVTFSLDIPNFRDDAHDTFGDQLPGKFISEEEMLAGIDRVKDWKSIWRRLNHDQRFVVKQMLLGRTQIDIAKELKVNPATIFQRYRKAIVIAEKYHSKKEAA